MPDDRPMGVPPDPETMGPAFRRLCEVVAKLRSPDGCAGDARVFPE